MKMNMLSSVELATRDECCISGAVLLFGGIKCPNGDDRITCWHFLHRYNGLL